MHQQFFQTCFEKFIPLAGPVVLLICAAVITSSAASTVAKPDLDEEGWRLTIEGWEHISTWNVPPRTPAAITSNTDAPHRQDIFGVFAQLHPASWSMLMVFLSLAGLTLLPGSEPPDDDAIA